MDISTDTRVELARLQREIENLLNLRETELLFEFRDVDQQVRLDLVTVNPRHRQSFLFRTETGHDRTETLRKMLDYVRDYRERDSSFTIQWRALGEPELNTSYFRAKHVYEALDKLYFGRDMHTITVYSVVLNPIA
jgi:hypothetical protein